MRCGIGLLGGQRLSMAPYVRLLEPTDGPRTGRPPPEGANVVYAQSPILRRWPPQEPDATAGVAGGCRWTSKNAELWFASKTWPATCLALSPGQLRRDQREAAKPAVQKAGEGVYGRLRDGSSLGGLLVRLRPRVQNSALRFVQNSALFGVRQQLGRRPRP